MSEAHRYRNIGQDTVLLAGPDAAALDRQRHILDSEGFAVVATQLGSEVQQLLEGGGSSIDALVLDWMLPDMDGFELVEWMKSAPGLPEIEVIILSTQIDPPAVERGIALGVFYYLASPVGSSQFLATVRTAVSSAELKRSLWTRIHQSQGALALLQEGRFYFRTLEEAEALAAGLAAPFERAHNGVGLFELLANAVEHGNLGITYDEKTQLLEDGTFAQEVARRLALPQNSQKKVEVDVKRRNGGLTVEISDEGNGFDYEQYLRFDQGRTFDSHGRGILLANSVMKIEYVEPGNRVRVDLDFRRKK